ncbi:MAG: class I tRNA ligase family protein, partial [Actinomycetes bacterium]
DLPLPSRIDVHDYLTVNGEKIAKSSAQAADPGDLVERFGADAVRWWLLREPARVGTSDFTESRLVDAYNRDLANSLGNLTSRCLTLTAGQPTFDAATPVAVGPAEAALVARAQALRQLVDDALDRYDFRAATRAICSLAEEGNRFIEAEAPWALAKQAASGDPVAATRLQSTLASLLFACRTAALELAAFVPEGAERLLAQLDAPTQRPSPVFPRKQVAVSV